MAMLNNQRVSDLLQDDYVYSIYIYLYVYLFYFIFILWLSIHPILSRDVFIATALFSRWVHQIALTRITCYNWELLVLAGNQTDLAGKCPT